MLQAHHPKLYEAAFEYMKQHMPGASEDAVIYAAMMAAKKALLEQMHVRQMQQVAVNQVEQMDELHRILVKQLMDFNVVIPEN